MKRIIIAAALCVSTAAFAQQQRPTDAALDGRMQACIAQRNEANDRIILVGGENAELRAEVARLKAEVEKLTPKQDEKKAEKK